jgi:[ribosomal protein S5]-alanine N-acetyltransferase
MSNLHFPAAIPILLGQGFQLRELNEADIPPWFERATDAESADLAGDPIPDSIEKGTAWLERHRQRFREKTNLRWSIVPTTAQRSIGTVGLLIKSNETVYAELGIVVARSHWGAGFGTAASRLVVQYGFDEVGLPEIRAEVLERNPASIRLLEKTGFELVRHLTPTDEEPEPMILYAISRRK